MAEVNNKLFEPERESVENFLSRFAFSNRKLLRAAKDDPLEQAGLLGDFLPKTVILEVQQKLQPKVIQDATFDDLIKILKASYSTKKSTVGAALAFFKRTQQVGESLESYARALNDLANQCGYEENTRERNLRDQFIAGLQSSKIIEILITQGEEKSFEECVARAKTLVQISADVEDINTDRAGRWRVHLNKQHYSRTDPKKSFYRKNYSMDDKNARINDSYVCVRCTAKGKHFAKECFALNMKCNKCSKIGHLARACKSKSQWRSNRTNYINEQGYQTPPEEIDQEEFVPVRHVRQRKAAPPSQQQHTTLRNRYAYLSDNEEDNNDWPSIQDQRHFRYHKKRKEFRRCESRAADHGTTTAAEEGLHHSNSISRGSCSRGSQRRNSGKKPFLGKHASKILSV